MTTTINSHVERLHRFLPFSAAHDQIYEEYQTEKDTLDLNTVALDYTKRAIDASAKLIILTGDAGHGKTHMCRRLIESTHLDHPPMVARELLRTKCDAASTIYPAENVHRRSLRIHKDLSEVHPPSRAAEILEHAGRENETLIVCANEGRLRAIVNSVAAGPMCRQIRELIASSSKTGRTSSASSEVHIVNLNYQSVSAYNSLLKRVLREWVGNGRRWTDKSCGSCTANGKCPIRHNRTLLAEDEVKSASRIDRLAELFQILERLGVIITIREMLMLVAYILTGGLTCRDVQDRVIRQGMSSGWQHEYAYYNLLFGCPSGLPNERLLKGIPTLTWFRRLDPGCVALREIDEKILHNGDVFDEGQLDLLFKRSTGKSSPETTDAALGIEDFSGLPTSKLERQQEYQATISVISALRRRFFFDDQSSERNSMSRLGFKFGDDFNLLLEDGSPRQQKLRIKNTIIAGLHAIQGLRLARSETTLNLVDPAFGKASSEAAIIARQISGASVQLLSATTAWGLSEDVTWSTEHSVDWIDRSITLRIQTDSGSCKDLALNLFTFECIGRAALGYVSEDFYLNELRKIRTFLGQLAEDRTGDSARIDVFTHGKIQQVSLDEGVIQVGGESL